MCLGEEQTALGHSTPTMRSTVTESKYLTQTQTLGWTRLPLPSFLKAEGATQHVSHHYTPSSVRSLIKIKEKVVVGQSGTSLPKIK